MRLACHGSLKLLFAALISTLIATPAVAQENIEEILDRHAYRLRLQALRAGSLNCSGLSHQIRPVGIATKSVTGAISDCHIERGSLDLTGPLP